MSCISVGRKMGNHAPRKQSKRRLANNVHAPVSMDTSHPERFGGKKGSKSSLADNTRTGKTSLNYLCVTGFMIIIVSSEATYCKEFLQSSSNRLSFQWC